MSDHNSRLNGGLTNSRDGNDRSGYQDRGRSRTHHTKGNSNNYNDNYRGGRSRGGGHYSYNGGRGGGRGGYRDNRPPPPPGQPAYDRALSAPRPRFGATGGRGRGRGQQRLPGNVKERTNQVFVSEQVLLSKEIITRLGDFRSDPNDPEQMLSDMREMTEVLVSTNDLKQFKDDMTELFIKCMSQLTVQGPLIATLLAMISKANNEFPLFVVNKMVALLYTHISKGEILHAKLLLRSLAVMASAGALALHGEGGFEALIGELLSGAEGGAGSGFTYVQQACTYLLASAAPYMATLLVHSSNELALRCKSINQRVLSEWKSPFDTNGKHAVFNVNTIMLDDATQGPEDMACWDTLWEACHMARQIYDGEMAASGAVGVTAEDGLHVHSSSFTYPTCFLRPWTQIAEDMTKNFELAEVIADDEEADKAAAEGAPVEASIDSSPAEVVPVKEGGLLRFNPEDARSLSELLSSAQLEDTLAVSSNANIASTGKGLFSWLCAKFPIFDAETGPQAATCVNLSFFEKYFMSDIFRDIFFFFQPYIRDDGTHIGTVDQVALHQLAAFKLFPEDTTVHLEYLLIESMLLLIVQVPPACASGVYRIILELCKKNAKIPPAVAAVTGVLAQLFPAMDTSAWRAVTRWLSCHLTNSKLAWPYWDYWASEYSEAPTDGVHKAFMKLLVEQCSRAIPAQKLRAALPASLHDAIIEDFAPAASDMFGDSGGGSLAAVAKAVLQKVDSREDPDDLQEWLEEAHEGIDDALQSENWRVALLTKAILISGGRKTLSQLIGLIDKYRDILREMGESKEEQKVILESIMEVIGHDLGFAAILLDVMIRRGVVKAATLSTYISNENVVSALATDTSTFALAEIAVERSLDVANAVVAKRKTLIGRGVQMESDGDDVGPKDYSGAVTHVMSMGGGPSTPAEKSKPDEENTPGDGDLTGSKRTREDEDADEADDGDNDDDEHSRRRRKFDEEENDSAAGGQMVPAEVTAAEAASAELALVDSTLAMALADCKSIYSKVVATLLLGLSRRQKELANAASADEDDVGAMLDPWCMSAISLLRSILRSFHGAQATLAHNGDSEHMVCDAESVQFEISDVELTPQLRAIWDGFSCLKN